jgi:pimeloyl-ACP methyl ester carboxylesterase
MRVTPLLLLLTAACGGSIADSSYDKAVDDTDVSGDTAGGDDSASSDDSSTTDDSSSTDDSSTTDDSSSTDDSASTDDSGDDTSDPGDDTPETTDYREEGPWAVTVTTGSEVIDADCTLSYSVFAPTDGTDNGHVVVAHGFSRTAANVADWASHLASWGYVVLTPELCFSSFFDADHPRNAETMVTLADAVWGADEVTYVGHSAGGLSAALAAGADPNALGAVGLDAVDSAETDGLLAAPSITVPLYGLFGESGLCNSNNNGVTMLDAAPNSRDLRVPGGDHCDFESPSDDICRFLCAGAGSAYTEEEIGLTVRGMTTAFVAWQTGDDAGGEDWWEIGGDWYSYLNAYGIVQEI